jgi:hypothetical protein
MASPTTYRVKITPLVLTQLQDVFEYIEQHSPQNAGEHVVTVSVRHGARRPE